MRGVGVAVGTSKERGPCPHTYGCLILVSTLFLIDVWYATFSFLCLVFVHFKIEDDFLEKKWGGECAGADGE